MKRIALILLILALLAPSALALDRSYYVGTWVLSYSKDNGGANCELFYLADSGQLFYMNQTFDPDDVAFGRQYIGSWTETPDGIHVIYGNTAEADAFISADGFLMVSLGSGYAVPYGKVPEYDYGR